MKLFHSPHIHMWKTSYVSVSLAQLAVVLMPVLVAGSVFSGMDCRTLVFLRTLASSHSSELLLQFGEYSDSHPHAENTYDIISCVCTFSVLIAHLTVSLMRPLVVGSVFSGTDRRW